VALRPPAVPADVATGAGHQQVSAALSPAELVLQP
jgi:hypothetical protein